MSRSWPQTSMQQIGTGVTRVRAGNRRLRRWRRGKKERQPRPARRICLLRSSCVSLRMLLPRGSTRIAVARDGCPTTRIVSACATLTATMTKRRCRTGWMSVPRNCPELCSSMKKPGLCGRRRASAGWWQWMQATERIRRGHRGHALLVRAMRTRMFRSQVLEHMRTPAR